MLLWPACYANTALVQALTPSHIVVDLVDDQRLFPGNEGQRTVITEQYQQFIELGHRVMSNSPGLVETLGAEFLCGGQRPAQRPLFRHPGLYTSPRRHGPV